MPNVARVRGTLCLRPIIIKKTLEELNVRVTEIRSRLGRLGD